jgi:hypothetical protein
VNDQIAREAARADMAVAEAAKARALANSLLDIHLAWEQARLTAEAA